MPRPYPKATIPLHAPRGENGKLSAVRDTTIRHKPGTPEYRHVRSYHQRYYITIPVLSHTRYLEQKVDFPYQMAGRGDPAMLELIVSVRSANIGAWSGAAAIRWLGRKPLARSSSTKSRKPTWLRLNEDLEKLAQLDPRQSRVVEPAILRRPEEEIAEVLGVSPITVKRGCRIARVLLHKQFGRRCPRPLEIRERKSLFSRPVWNRNAKQRAWARSAGSHPCMVHDSCAWLNFRAACAPLRY
jgi:ECF sigma factor